MSVDVRKIKEPVAVVPGNIFLVLAVDSIDLPFSGGLREQGTQKELAEPEKSGRVSDSVSDFFPTRIRIFSIPDPRSRIHIKEFEYFNPPNFFFFKLSEI
jgi:hypothetical protein